MSHTSKTKKRSYIRGGKVERAKVLELTELVGKLEDKIDRLENELETYKRKVKLAKFHSKHGIQKR